MKPGPILLLVAALGAAGCKSTDQRVFEEEARIATRVFAIHEAPGAVQEVAACLTGFRPSVLNLDDLGPQGGSIRVLVNPVRHLLVHLDNGGWTTRVTIKVRPDRRALTAAQRNAFEACTR